MHKGKLGNTDLEIAPIVFGGNVFGWTADEKTSFKLMDQFTGEGFNFIDSANVYSRWVRGHKGGESETVIGKWHKKNNSRNKIIIASKVGMNMGEGKCLKKEYIIKEAEQSLKRLQTDHIDLYYAHINDPNTPIEETLEAFEQLIKEGKARYIGGSNYPKKELEAALKASEDNNLPKFRVYQTEFNLYDREEFETEYEKLCKENSLAVVSYFSLANGFLTGKYRTEKDQEKSTRGDRVAKFMNHKGNEILAALDEVAKKHDTDDASVSLAWLIQHPSIAAPIASATSLKQLESFTKATNLKLEKEDVKLLDEAGR